MVPCAKNLYITIFNSLKVFACALHGYYSPFSIIKKVLAFTYSFGRENYSIFSHCVYVVFLLKTLLVPGSPLVKLVQLVNNVSRHIRKLFVESAVEKLSKGQQMLEAL